MIKKLKYILNKFFTKSEFGYISIASLFVVIVSGILLSLTYEVKQPFVSLVSMILLSEPGSIIRNIHYWSGNIFIITLLLHIVSHLLKDSEVRMGFWQWSRLVFLLMVSFYAMISGFILKGDSDSISAFFVLKSLFDSIPLIGQFLSSVITGSDEKNLMILFVHHSITTTIFIIILNFEHSKIIWGEKKIFALTTFTIILLSFTLQPQFQDFNAVNLKGPWYFVGFQEALSLVAYPVIIVVAVSFGLILFGVLPILGETLRQKNKLLLLGMLLIYCVLTFKGILSDKGSEGLASPVTGSSPFSFNLMPELRTLFQNEKPEINLEKKILGRSEGCIYCHQNIKGLTGYHRTDSIGCYSCHGGNAFSINKNIAHSGIYKVPGNLSNSFRTCGFCHPELDSRVRNSLMNSMSGVVAVNKFVFDENSDLNKKFEISYIGFSPAERHLRNLCASCHLGTEKKHSADYDESSRGGGCISCHLSYNDSSRISLSNYRYGKQYEFHPDISLKVHNNACYGCHSRSGRISTSYAGLAEVTNKELHIPDSLYITFKDGRVFKKTTSDIHFESGIECIDCHNSRELMGDGNKYVHKEDVVTVQCVDCHNSGSVNICDSVGLDYETQKIVSLRNIVYGDSKIVRTQKKSIPLYNIVIKNNGKKYFIYKNTSSKDLLLKSPKNVCTNKLHHNLECNTCHSSWAYQCTGCHTEHNPSGISIDLLTEQKVKGEWVESFSNIYYDLPTLGVRELNEDKKYAIFIPGMIIKINEEGRRQIFKRLFAPVSPHTIRRESRSCQSCHFNPKALGLGTGEFVFVNAGSTLTFLPLQKNLDDGLPEDAWTGFLTERKDISATRTNCRSLNVTEQKAILEVGVCLTCHSEKLFITPENVFSLNERKKQIQPQCKTLNDLVK